MGRPVTYPFIRCLATEEGQTGHVYDNVHFNLRHGPLAEGLPCNAAGLTRVFLPGGGEILPRTASAASKDGGKETFVVATNRTYGLRLSCAGCSRRSAGTSRSAELLSRGCC